LEINRNIGLLNAAITVAKCSPDTALRDITQLLELGVLKKSPGGGRSTGYELVD
jgi:Fic family protein